MAALSETRSVALSLDRLERPCISFWRLVAMLVRATIWTDRLPRSLPREDTGGLLTEEADVFVTLFKGADSG